jgi:aminoglycoside phosphotransferase (APT) family kinase protein
MSYVEGSLLVDELRFANHLAHLDGFRSLERGYALAGRWLSHLREVTGVTDGGSRALDGIELRYRERAEMVRRSPMGGGYAALLGHIDGLMQAWRRSLSAAAIPTSGRHGDYGPWNMIFDGRRLVVIDFLGYQRDPILVDVLKILVHLEEVRSGFAASGRRVNRLKEAFLGAAGPLPSVPFELAAFVECAQRVVCWAGVETRSAQGALKRYDHRRTRERLLAWFASLPAVRPLWPTVS